MSGLRLLLAAALLLSLVAVATPASAFQGKTCKGRDLGLDAQVCVEDRITGNDPDCSAPGTSSNERTFASGDAAGFLVAFSIGGRETCSRSSTGSSYVAGWYASVGVAGTTWGAGWREYEFSEGNATTAEDCDIFVEAASQVQELGCPAGPPPNPGWGDVIPSPP